MVGLKGDVITGSLTGCIIVIPVLLLDVLLLYQFSYWLAQKIRYKIINIGYLCLLYMLWRNHVHTVIEQFTVLMMRMLNNSIIH